MPTDAYPTKFLRFIYDPLRTRCSPKSQRRLKLCVSTARDLIRMKENNIKELPVRQSIFNPHRKIHVLMSCRCMVDRKPVQIRAYRGTSRPYHNQAGPITFKECINCSLFSFDSRKTNAMCNGARVQLGDVLQYST